MTHHTDNKGQTVLSFVLAYVLWIAASAAAVWLFLQMRLLFLVELPMHITGLNPWTLSSIDKFGTVGLAVVFLIFVVLGEAYFRRLAERAFPLRAVVTVFLAEGLLIGGVYLWRFLL